MVNVRYRIFCILKPREGAFRQTSLILRLTGASLCTSLDGTTSCNGRGLHHLALRASREAVQRLDPQLNLPSTWRSA